jgi:hypothetical protein
MNEPANHIDPTGKFYTGEITFCAAIDGALWGAMGGALEGIISELMGWDGEDGFSWGNVGKAAGEGAFWGGLAGAGEGQPSNTQMIVL